MACVATCIEGIRNTRAKTGRSPAAGVFRITGTPRKHGEFSCFRFFGAVFSRPRPSADWGESLRLQRSRRLQDLLRFFVEERIAYGVWPVPQQRLAEEVLGKEADFSPTSNPHGRIYLRRLRQRVATYYAGPGAADPLVLGVTCGPYRLSVERRRRADAPVTKAPRLKATPNMVVLITELAASGLDGELHLLPSLVSRSLVPYLLGQDGIVAIGPVPRQRITQPAWQSPVVRSSVADCLLDGVMTVGSGAHPGGQRRRDRRGSPPGEATGARPGDQRAAGPAQGSPAVSRV